MQERSEATRQHLIDVALRLFWKNGFEGTTMQELVSSAGLTKGAFYHHFKTKDEILLLLHNRFLDDELERFEKVLAQHLSARDTLRRLIVESVVSVELHQAELSVWLRERRALSPGQLAVVEPKRQQFEQIITSVIKRGIESGEFRYVADARVTAFGIIGMCAWVHEWYRPDGAMPSREIGEMYADLLLAGLRLTPEQGP